MTQQIAKWACELCERQGRQRPWPRVHGVLEIVDGEGNAQGVEPALQADAKSRAA